MLVSNGNRKIGDDTLILNMTSATDCPSKALGLCKIPGICYAMKAERQYPQVLPYRRAQTLQWDKMTAGEIGAGLMAIVRAARHEIKYVRFSEAGDFRTQADVDKMSELAEYLNTFNIRVYGYTARQDLDFSRISSNMIVNGSGFKVSNNFQAVPKTQPLQLMCPGNCRSCSLCKTSNNLTIGVAFH